MMLMGCNIACFTSPRETHGTVARCAHRDARAQRLTVVRPLVVVGPTSPEGYCYVVAIRATQQAGVMQVRGEG
jgi:hypothetical protein